MQQSFDIIIVGGGPVGATLALSLAHLPLRIALIEAKQPSNDKRVLALTQVSTQIYTTLGIWPKLAAHATPIEHIHVSDRGHFGKTRFHARDVGVAALGYTIALQQLQAALPLPANCELLCPAQIESIQIEPQFATLAVNTPHDQRLLQAKLVIAADGAESFIRQALNIPTLTHDYQQHALVAQVHCSKPHHYTAYERFTTNGPLALLPLTRQQVALVWIGQTECIQHLKNVDEKEFLNALQQTFGYHLGKFVAVETRQSFPLRLVWAKEQIRSRLVIIGNASHSIHPIAAQGFNLGLRDVAMLAQVLQDWPGYELGSLKLLQQYIEQRQADQNLTIHTTHSLVQLFSNNLSPLAHARSLGMLALDICPSAKNLLTRRAMGFTSNMSWLSISH